MGQAHVPGVKGAQHSGHTLRGAESRLGIDRIAHQQPEQPRVLHQLLLLPDGDAVDHVLQEWKSAQEKQRVLDMFQQRLGDTQHSRRYLEVHWYSHAARFLHDLLHRSHLPLEFSVRVADDRVDQHVVHHFLKDAALQCQLELLIVLGHAQSSEEHGGPETGVFNLSLTELVAGVLHGLRRRERVHIKRHSFRQLIEKVHRRPPMDFPFCRSVPLVQFHGAFGEDPKSAEGPLEATHDAPQRRPGSIGGEPAGANTSAAQGQYFARGQHPLDPQQVAAAVAGRRSAGAVAPSGCRGRQKRVIAT